MIRIGPSKSEAKLFDMLSVPLQRNAGFYVNITRYYTDVNGTVINAAALPAGASALKNRFPFWMFGEFDRWGGYQIGNQVAPPDKGIFYVGSFIVGFGAPFLFATGLNTVQRNLTIGDVVHIFTDNIDAPSAYAWIVQSCPSVALGSVYGNATASEKQKIRITGANYFAYTNGQVNLQFIQRINLTRIDVVGAYSNQPTDPLGSKQVKQFQDFVYYPIKFTVDQYSLISGYLDFTVDSIQFSFMIKKNTDKV